MEYYKAQAVLLQYYLKTVTTTKKTIEEQLADISLLANAPILMEDKFSRPSTKLTLTTLIRDLMVEPLNGPLNEVVEIINAFLAFNMQYELGL
jgi:hypothetical protein